VKTRRTEGCRTFDLIRGIRIDDRQSASSQGYLNKFSGTDLEKILKERGIRTVIATGFAVTGAVLTTASELVVRGLAVVVPVDGVASFNAYAEQYSAWHFVNSPVVAGKVTLTRVDMMKF
jgi:nicotinamidase-related amidase